MIMCRAEMDEGAALRDPEDGRPGSNRILWDVRRKDGSPYAIESCAECGRDVVLMSLRAFHDDFVHDRTCRQCRRRKMSEPLPIVILAAAIAAL